MLGEQRFIESVQRGGDGGHLGDDIYAVALIFHHGADAAHLSLDAVQAVDQIPVFLVFTVFVFQTAA